MVLSAQKGIELTLDETVYLVYRDLWVENVFNLREIYNNLKLKYFDFLK